LQESLFHAFLQRKIERSTQPDLIRAGIGQRDGRRHGIGEAMFPYGGTGRLTRCRAVGTHAIRQHGFQRLSRAPVIEVFLQRVDFPERLIRIGDPEFGLARVTALDPLFALRADAGQLQALLHGDQRGGIRHTEAEMVKRPADRPRRRLQRQYNRRIVQLEFGIIRPLLGRIHTEQNPVERNRAFKVRDVEREVETDGGSHR